MDTLRLVDEGPAGFHVAFKDHVVLRHRATRPCLALARGEGKFADSHGLYRIKDKITERHAFTTHVVDDASPGRVAIRFSGKDIEVTVVLAIVNDRLEMTVECAREDVNRFTINLPAEPTEAIYGCGEQFSKLNLRGYKVPLWIGEQGICRGDPKFHTWLLNLFAGVGGNAFTTYHAQPTFVSSARYYVHATSTVHAVFDFTSKDRHSLCFWGNPERIIIDVAPTATGVVSGLSALLGRQPPLPEWIFDGMILAIQGTDGCEGVERRLQRALDAGVKTCAIWSQDWQGIKKTSFGTQLFWDWKWNGNGRPVRFNDFPGFVARMRERGIRYMGYINSFLNIDGDMYAEASEKDYLVKDPAGKDYLVYVTTFPVAILDVTNPAAREWMKGIITRNLIEEAGVAGWMSDFGEYLPVDAVLHSGEPAGVVHNRYPVEWQKLNFEAVEAAGKLGEVVFFTRAGYSGTSRYSTLVWAGDQLPTWSVDDGLPSVIPAALSLGTCGVGYHHSDIGGYTTFKPFFVRTKELFMRWAEHSAFTAVMRTHESNRPEVNVQFDTDDEILAHLARMTRVHVHLKPYLLALSREYQETGLPVMRPLFLHHEHDPAVHRKECWYQYLLGRDLLVAPVIKKGKKTWAVYLPTFTKPGDAWIHAWSGQQHGPGRVVVDAPLGQPPVFYRAGSSHVILFEALKTI